MNDIDKKGDIEGLNKSFLKMILEIIQKTSIVVF